jgi:hypothetical protein
MGPGDQKHWKDSTKGVTKSYLSARRTHLSVCITRTAWLDDSGQFPRGHALAQSSPYDHSASEGQNPSVPLVPNSSLLHRLSLASLRLCVRFSSPFRQHEIPDDGSELAATGNELSQGTAGRTVGVECVNCEAVFRVGSAEIDELL